MTTARRRATSAVALVAALAAGHWLTTTFQTGGSSDGSFVRTGVVGDLVHLEYADVRVRDVRPAQRLLGALTVSTPTQASGVYVVVTVELTAARERTYFSTTQLVDTEDRAYLPSDKSECAGTPSSQTGVTTYAMLCFEVPTDRLAGLRAQVARGGTLDDSLRRDEVAELDLAVSTEDEAEWAATTAAYGAVGESLEPFLPEPVEIDEEPSS